MGQNISAQTTLGSKDLMAELAAYYDRNYYANDSTVPYDRQYRHNVFLANYVEIQNVTGLTWNVMNTGSPDTLTWNGDVIFESDAFRSYEIPYMHTVKSAFFKLNSSYDRENRAGYYFALTLNNELHYNLRTRTVATDPIRVGRGISVYANTDLNVNVDSEYDQLRYPTTELFKVFQPHFPDSFRTRGLRVVSCVIASLDKNDPVLSPIFRDFKNDFFYPIQVTFEFDNRTKKGFVFIKNKDNEFYFVSVGFLKYWITNFK